MEESLFEKPAFNGLIGNNPTIPLRTTVNNTIPFQYDFRRVYASLLQNWFCVDPAGLRSIVLNHFQSLNIVEGSTCHPSKFPEAGTVQVSNFPNPCNGSTTIRFTTRGGHTSLQIIDTLGHVVGTLVDRVYAAPGTFTVPFHSQLLAPGIYYVRLQNGAAQQVHPMLKVR